MRPSFQIPKSFPPGYAEEYRGTAVRNVAIAFLVLEVVFVSLRIVSQRLGRKRIGLDDWLVAPSFFFCLALDIAVIVEVVCAKLGYHTIVVIALHPDEFVLSQKIAITLPILWSLACAFSRLSILTMYMRIFVDRWQQITCCLVIAMVVAECLTCIILDVISCVPLSMMWDLSAQGTCFDIANFYRWAPVPNLLIDTIMLLLPLPTVWQLRASNQMKVGLVATFLTGSIGLVTATMRTVTFFQHDYNDPNSWAIVVYILWSVIEPGVYLIAACLTCFKPLVNTVLYGRQYGARYAYESSNKHRISEFGRHIDATLLSLASEDEVELQRGKSVDSVLSQPKKPVVESWPLKD